MKKTLVMMGGKTTYFIIDGEDVKEVDSCCLLESIINNRGSNRNTTQIGTRQNKDEGA